MKNSSKESGKYWFRSICNLLITTIIIIAFTFIWNKYLNVLLYQSYLLKGNYLMIGIYGILAIMFVNLFGGYEIGINRRFNVILAQSIGLLCLNIVEIILTILMVGRLHLVGIILLSYLKLYILQVISLFVVTVLAMTLYRKIFPPYKMLHIFGPFENNLPEKLGARSDKYMIAGKISCDESLANLEETIKDYDAVLINDVPSERRNKILKICFSQAKRVYFTPKISDIIVKGSLDLRLFDTPLYYCRNTAMPFLQRVIKRIGDIFFSFFGIIITSPIMICTAIAIFLYDRGPVFYRQTRCTIDGKRFRIFKFRSMITNAEEDGIARLATEHDNRITPIGKFIRAFRIDELPQFFNILNGDMSIVGPRPERPEIIDEYFSEVPEFKYRLRVKAGLTGYAQVYGKYNTTSYDKLKLDMIYVENCSIRLDIELILLTLKVIFQKESTEGLVEGLTNASTKNINNLDK